MTTSSGNQVSKYLHSLRFRVWAFGVFGVREAQQLGVQGGWGFHAFQGVMVWAALSERSKKCQTECNVLAKYRILYKIRIGTLANAANAVRCSQEAVLPIVVACKLQPYT